MPVVHIVTAIKENQIREQIASTDLDEAKFHLARLKLGCDNVNLVTKEVNTLFLKRDLRIKDTESYERLLNELKRFYTKHKLWPTYEELAYNLCWTKSAVVSRLRVLNKAGYIILNGGIRGIRLK